jgi:hypothetical protein
VGGCCQGGTGSRVIVGIMGKKGHGKDSLAEAIIKMSPMPARRVAFADPIKEMVHLGLGVPREILWGPAELKEQVDPRFGVSYRHMLQTLGTEWGRDFVHKDVWVRLAFDEHIPSIEKFLGEQLWLCTDVRFLNEAEAIWNKGGLIVEIYRPGFSTGQHEDHASETESTFIVADCVVINNGKLSYLDDAAEWFLRSWVEGEEEDPGKTFRTTRSEDE